VAEEEEALANRAAEEDSTTVARHVMLAVASATWQKTAARDRSATIAVVWDMSAAIATKRLKRKFATDASNPGTFPVTAPTTPSNRARLSRKGMRVIASDHPP